MRSIVAALFRKAATSLSVAKRLNPCSKRLCQSLTGRVPWRRILHSFPARLHDELEVLARAFAVLHTVLLPALRKLDLTTG